MEKSGFHTLFDLTTENLPNSQGVIAAKRDFVAANPQLSLDDDDVASATDDFFTGAVVPSVLLAQPNQFADSIALREKNDRIVGFDISRFIDSSYVQKAAAAGLDKAPKL